MLRFLEKRCAYDRQLSSSAAKVQQKMHFQSLVTLAWRLKSASRRVRKEVHPLRLLNGGSDRSNAAHARHCAGWVSGSSLLCKHHQPTRDKVSASESQKLPYDSCTFSSYKAREVSDQRRNEDSQSLAKSNAPSRRDSCNYSFLCSSMAPATVFRLSEKRALHHCRPFSYSSLSKPVHFHIGKNTLPRKR